MRKEGREGEGGGKQRRRRQQLDFVVPWKFPPAIINHDKAPLVVDGAEGEGRERGGRKEEEDEGGGRGRRTREEQKNKPKSATAAKRGETSPPP